MLGLCCCAGFSLVSESGGYSLAVVLGLLISVASPVVEQGLSRMRASVAAAHGLSCTGLIIVAYELSSSTARGILPNQGLNPCLLYWQVDSLRASHQESSSTFSDSLLSDGVPQSSRNVLFSFYKLFLDNLIHPHGFYCHVYADGFLIYIPSCIRQDKLSQPR